MESFEYWQDILSKTFEIEIRFSPEIRTVEIVEERKHNIIEL